MYACISNCMALRVLSGVIVVSMGVGKLVKSSLRSKGEGQVHMACETDCGFSAVKDKWGCETLGLSSVKDR